MENDQSEKQPVELQFLTPFEAAEMFGTPGRPGAPSPEWEVETAAGSRRFRAENINEAQALAEQYPDARLGTLRRVKPSSTL